MAGVLVRQAKTDYHVLSIETSLRWKVEAWSSIVFHYSCCRLAGGERVVQNYSCSYPWCHLPAKAIIMHQRIHAISSGFGQIQFARPSSEKWRVSWCGIMAICCATQLRIYKRPSMVVRTIWDGILWCSRNVRHSSSPLLSGWDIYDGWKKPRHDCGKSKSWESV